MDGGKYDGAMLVSISVMFCQGGGILINKL